MATDKVSVTLEQALDVAARYDIVVATRSKFTPYVAAMRAANPNLKLMVYENAAFAQKNEGTRYPSSWYAHDQNGNRVTSIGFGNYLMDITNPAWAQDGISRCQTDLSANGYDGCYFDMLLRAPLLPSYVSGLPVDSRTGTVWTSADFATAVVKLATALRTGLPGIPLAGNELTNGSRYFATDGSSNAPLLGVLDAAHDEIWLRGGSTGVTRYPTEKQWLQYVNMLVDIGSRGEQAMIQTKVWVPATAAQLDAWHRYTVASFLLGTDGRSYLNFSSAQTMPQMTADSPYDRVDVGSPLGAYAKVAGVYQRTFTKGIAMVNPTAASIAVPLAAAYRNLDGAVVTSVVLGPNSGQVLTAE